MPPENKRPLEAFPPVASPEAQPSLTSPEVVGTSPEAIEPTVEQDVFVAPGNLNLAEGGSNPEEELSSETPQELIDREFEAEGIIAASKRIESLAETDPFMAITERNALQAKKLHEMFGEDIAA